ncbi:putative RNA modification enzyme, MiaB family [Megalodesulfovibrio gigas DSM 1382 = ATCC 19364]|uniref:tRNA-2-methylthio-N(6)-dimethylallyladenosine synthase n=2 Tax=Megalodesulfovibrio gigas TaxID=879 RepID=T2GBY5_MEGG1|nr:putative RNA modification enzyme, MiaB family [Megalodesulfovibrio gigas DSM 1382 = ATCC 19364]
MQFHTMTFGCQMNVHDAAWLDRALVARGHARHPVLLGPGEELSPQVLAGADCVILHTCSVREKPEQKVYSLLGRLAAYFRANPRAFCAVGGCVAQQVGPELWRRFPFVRLVFGGDSLPEAPEALERLLAHPRLRISLLDFSESWRPREDHLEAAPPSPQAFVTIMVGCDNWCSYCIVPSVRGPQRSRPFADILDECRRLVDAGAREITLLGQNVNAYGLDLGPGASSFAELLRAVARLPGLVRLRFTTSHPKDLDEAVIAAFGEESTLAPMLHLPVQSGSDRVLEAMGRRYTVAHYHKLIDALRAARPDMAFSTDFIVGFPGETEADFQETLDLIRQVRYASAFSFCYTDRPGTKASAMLEKIDPAQSLDRLARLQALQQEISESRLETFVGHTVEVLLEGPARRQDTAGLVLTGRDAWNRVVNVHDPEGLIRARQDRSFSGMMVPVRIDAALKHSLAGKAAGATW